MPYSLKCAGCGKQFQFAADPAGRRFKCKSCGQLIEAPAAEATPVDDDPEPERPRRRKARRRAPSNWCRFPLLLLMGAYFPFLALVAVPSGALGGWLIWWGVNTYGTRDQEANLFTVPAIVLGALLALTSLHLLVGLHALFRRTDEKDELEFELPEQWQEGLAVLVDRVASERDLPVPDVIRLHAVDVAKIYHDRRGQAVLVVGGVAVAALSQPALAGIIAHELGHLGAGDTQLLRLAARWHQVMMQLEKQFWHDKLSRWNPLVWLIRLYHWVYALLWFANMRQAEYAADYHEVEHVGKEKAAASLMLVTLLHYMEWANLGAVAEACVETNQQLSQIFAEQVRRLRVARLAEWEDALRKAGRESTGWFDTHPGLKDRLKAIGVSPKKALRLAMDVSGEPATALFANWPVVEKFLTDKIMTIVRDNYLARQDYEAVARAVLREEAQMREQG